MKKTKTKTKNLKRKKERKKEKSPIKKALKLFGLYSLLYMTIFLFLDMFALYFYNPIILIIISLFLGVLTAFNHVRIGKKTRIEEVEKELGID